MKRIAVVVASRANYARLKTVIAALGARRGVEPLVIVGGSALCARHGRAIDLIENDGVSVAARAEFAVADEGSASMARATGQAMIEFAAAFERLRPDCALLIGDRHETLAAATSASYMNIVVAHCQGGEVTGSLDESVRHAITKLAHLHFPATRLARERLLRLGEDPRRVHWVGCPAIDLIGQTDLEPKPGEILAGCADGGYLIVQQHSVTSEEDRAGAQMTTTLAALADLDLPAIVLTPNSDRGSAAIRAALATRLGENVSVASNFAPGDFLALMRDAGCLVGNSSSAIREGAFLGVPAVNIGSRQQHRERGRNVVDAPHDRAAIVTAVRKQIAVGRYPSDPLYGDGRASERIAALLADSDPNDVPIQKRLHYPDLLAEQRQPDSQRRAI